MSYIYESILIFQFIIQHHLKSNKKAQLIRRSRINVMNTCILPGSKIQMANLPIFNIPKLSLVSQCSSNQSVLSSTAIRLDTHYVTDNLM